MGATCLALVTAATAWRLGAPAALVAVVAATLAVEMLPSVLADVQVLGELPAEVPPIRIPAVTAGDVGALLPISAVIALLAARTRSRAPEPSRSATGTTSTPIAT